MRSAGVNPEVLDKAEQEAAEFTARHDELIADAIAQMLRARLELGRVVHAAIDPATIESGPEREVYQELLRNSGARTHLERSTTEKLEAMLTPEQRSRMRKRVVARRSSAAGAPAGREGAACTA
jgi:hypothetical protein